MITRSCEVVGSAQHRTLILPDDCPLCGAAIVPQIIRVVMNNSLYTNDSHGMSAAMACPSCQGLFVVSYPEVYNGANSFTKVEPRMPKQKKFDPRLSDISLNFIEIYNQALAAETYGLTQISGMGYRKALEFLIKDYAKILDPAESENIEKEMLSKVIQKYIDHPKIKATATASVWIGNDETHYIRKFEDKDVNDLKRLIDSCVYWILADYDASDASTMVSKKA